MEHNNLFGQFEYGSFLVPMWDTYRHQFIKSILWYRFCNKTSYNTKFQSSLELPHEKKKQNLHKCVQSTKSECQMFESYHSV